MPSNNFSFIAAGSSITDTTAWPTWATWVKHRYNPDVFINAGIKGAGNELILLKAIESAQQHKNPFLLVQLTNVDKWDWYVEDPVLADMIDQEKHPLVKLNKDDYCGFWSTGSHFPKWKDYYKHHYFSLEYSTYQTLQLIQWFQLLCHQQKWKYYIMFDSPVLSVTESELNTGVLLASQCNSTKLVNNTISNVLFNLIDIKNIYLPGIIGYAVLHSYQWYNDKFKGHPGSLVHYNFTKDVVCPVLDQMVEPVQELASFKNDAIVFQKLFNNTQ